MTLKSALGALSSRAGSCCSRSPRRSSACSWCCAPLHLALAGWSTAAIGAVFLVGSAFEATESPFVGRLSDSRGALFPARLAFAGEHTRLTRPGHRREPVVYAPLVVLAGMSYGAMFTPSFTLVSDGAASAGLAQGMAFGLMNAAWATGALIGPAVAGTIAGATGDAIPFVLAALCSVAALVLLRPPVGVRAHARSQT